MHFGEKTGLLIAVFALLLLTSCSPPTGSKFLTAFDPAVTLNTIGASEGIKYSNSNTGISANKALIGGVNIDKDWTFYFKGSHSQLLKQLDRFRVEVEREIAAGGGAISGRGEWQGDFSGFSFKYRSGGVKGFLRVSGISTESGQQGIEIFVFEH